MDDEGVSGEAAEALALSAHVKDLCRRLETEAQARPTEGNWAAVQCARDAERYLWNVYAWLAREQ